MPIKPEVSLLPHQGLVWMILSTYRRTSHVMPTCGSIQGMKKIENLAGRKFGRWTVIREASLAESPPSGRAAWVCRCTCGSSRAVIATNLVKGTSKSCGCSHSEEKRRGPFLDLTGKVYGKVKVLRPAGKSSRGGYLWACQCSCGKEFVSRSADLSFLKVLSCGCSRAESIRKKLNVGDKFGCLTVMADAGMGKFRDSLSRCLCDCGRQVTVRNYAVRKGWVKSCGHLRHERIPEGVASKNSALRSLKTAARARKLQWSLTDDAAFVFMAQPCYWCGREKVNQMQGGLRPDGTSRYRGAFRYNGLDRLDNGKGYVLGNVVACCGRCNRSRGALLTHDFIEMCVAVAARHMDRASGGGD